MFHKYVLRESSSQQEKIVYSAFCVYIRYHEKTQTNLKMACTIGMFRYSIFDDVCVMFVSKISAIRAIMQPIWYAERHFAYFTPPLYQRKRKIYIILITVAQLTRYPCPVPWAHVSLWVIGLWLLDLQPASNKSLNYLSATSVRFREIFLMMSIRKERFKCENLESQLWLQDDIPSTLLWIGNFALKTKHDVLHI